MKLIPVIMYLKKCVEEIRCDRCDISLTFSNVEFNDYILMRGGYVECQGYCKECGKDHMMYMSIKPVKDEYLN